MNELEAFSQTVDHIRLVQRLLLSAQIELSRRAVTHDQSKLESPEWEMFRDVTHTLKGLTYGSDAYKEQLELMRTQGSLAHHYEHNRHHPEHFQNGINDMNLFDLLEMLIDWLAATQRHTDGDIYHSIEINRNRFGMSDQLTQIMLNTIPWIAEEFYTLHTQKDLQGLTDI